MNITYKVFDDLPNESKFIRTIVFVDEQHFVDEFESNENKAIHIVMYDEDKPIATSRIIYQDKHKCYVIGRFAVMKEYRKLGIGKELMKFTEDEIIKRFGHIQIGVSSQIQAQGFYEKCGYKATSETYLDQHCPHIWMVKYL